MLPIQRQRIKKVDNIAVTTHIPSEESGLSKLVFKASVKRVLYFCGPEKFAMTFL